MQEYVIQQKQKSKGRAFVATPLALVVANSLFPEGSVGDTCRPVWAMFAGTETSLRPFVANLRLGRKAEPYKGYHSRQGDSERIEFLKSINYQVTWQKEPEGCLVTLYHPELFRLDPGMVDPLGIQFVMLVPTEWAASQRIDPKPAVDHMRDFEIPFLTEEMLMTLAPAAYLFAAYLDRRTRCPLVTDGRFYLQLLCMALQKGFASFPGSNLKYDVNYHATEGINKAHSFRAKGLEQVGISLAVSFLADHKLFEEFLAEQVTLFFERTEGTTLQLEAANG